MEETLIVFGQGDTKMANLKTHIGDMEATVLDNVPTLISPVPVIQAGGSMHLEGDGGYIANTEVRFWPCQWSVVLRFGLFGELQVATTAGVRS